MKNSLYSTYGLVVALLAALTAAILACRFHHRGWKKRWAIVYALTAALSGLLLGRGIYCSIHAMSVFYDPMGRFMGIAPFFDPRAGSVSVIGLVLGCLIASPVTARFMKVRTAALLDVLALPLTLLLCLSRFAEPLSGQGFGPAVEAPWLCWAPLAIQNGWGGWMLSICFIEAMLLLGIVIALLRFRPRQPGALFLTVLLLVTASQLIPESLRRDNALKLFTFARVNQIGFVAMFFGGCTAGWLRSVRQGQPKKPLWLELALTLLGIALLILGEFALDKTQWPDPLIYLVMTAILLGMLILSLRRTLRSDKPAAA